MRKIKLQVSQFVQSVRVLKVWQRRKILWRQKNKSVMDDVSENKYLKMCKQKRGRNNRFLKQVVDDIKRAKKTTPRNSPCNRTKIQLGNGDRNTSPSVKGKTSSPKHLLKQRAVNKSTPKKKGICFDNYCYQTQTYF